MSRCLKLSCSWLSLFYLFRWRTVTPAIADRSERPLFFFIFHFSSFFHFTSFFHFFIFYFFPFFLSFFIFYFFIFLHFFSIFISFVFLFMFFFPGAPWAPPGLPRNIAFYYANLDFKARIWMKERKKERADRKTSRTFLLFACVETPHSDPSPPPPPISLAFLLQYLAKCPSLPSPPPVILNCNTQTLFEPRPHLPNLPLLARCYKHGLSPSVQLSLSSSWLLGLVGRV